MSFQPNLSTQRMISEPKKFAYSELSALQPDGKRTILMN
ncbi:hypothetical protein BLA47_15070 [Yersinia pseudotuberculosis]|nr:hypothetical protein B7R75_16710 [Yersinia pseudotuberculosis]PSH36142.1 hypothetical protein BA192_02385 [Yersinia pseudotuberculosis]PSH36903.1 hypothetical protein BLA47_15070 [Yersinia pseudotuberculosis]